MNRTSTLGKRWTKVSTWTLATVASAMVALVIIPASFWRAPEVDIHQVGFDAVTMYSDASAAGENAGAVDITSSRTVITALQGSDAVVHLTTTPLSYSASFSLRVDRADRDSAPLSVAVTSPYLNDEFRLSLGPEPTRSVSLDRIEDGQVTDSTPLGVYSLGRTYDVKVELDRDRKAAVVSMISRSADEPTTALFVPSSGTEFESHLITDEPIGVTAGELYTFSVDTLSSIPGLVGLSLEWLDRGGQRVNVDSDWAETGPANDVWVGRQVQSTAPEGAVAVRPEFAVAGEGSVSVGNLWMSNPMKPELNLLPGNDFSDGAEGWRRSEGTKPIEVREYPVTELRGSVSAGDFPELFEALRMALTVSSSAGEGVAQATLTQFEMTVPHQRWMAVKVSDPVLSALLISLGAVGLAVLVLLVIAFSRSERGRHTWARITRPLVVRPTRTFVLAVVAVAVYSLVSLVLANNGSLNADIIGARIWAYVSGTSGIDAMYFDPNVSSAEAGQWQGVPLQEAGFPYGPAMAYIFGALGLLYSSGIHQEALGQPDATSIDFLVRMANGFFGFVDAWLVVLIVRGFGVPLRRSLVVGGVFLLAPALAFANSVWGTTQSMSLVFLLAAILFVQRKTYTAAWVFLLAAMMTRPQNLVAAAIIALFLVRASPVRTTLRSLSLAIVIVFVAILPLSMTISPTLPVDVTMNALFMHVGNGNDTWTLPVSWGAFGPWLLVATMVDGVFGTESILFPATTPLIGSLTYYQVGTYAFLAFMVALAAVVLVRGKGLMSDGRFLIAATLAVLALLQLKTGAPSYHMLLPTALSFLLIRAVPRWAYVFTAATLSVTTFISMSGMGAYWLSNHPEWGVGVYDPNFWASQLLSAAVQSPAVVIVASLANTAVIIVLIGCLLARDPRRESTPSHQQGNDRTSDQPVFSNELDANPVSAASAPAAETESLVKV